MGQARLVIAGTNSGVGKTTVTLGLMAAFGRRGQQVQGFKVGPDYIDPSYHAAVTKRPSRNLDSWMLSEQTLLETYRQASDTADLSIIEGVMGFYDGHSPLDNQGSTAEISLLLQAPVILVLDVSSMARSAAAIVKGFQQLEPRVSIAGVIANRVGSEGHYSLVKAAIEDACGVPVLGYLLSSTALHLPERHLGLIPAIERGKMDSLFERLAEEMEATIDVDHLFHLARQAPSLAASRAPVVDDKPQIAGGKSVATIAIARDAAFNFYYPENLELLERSGAKLAFFSPLAGETVPEGADGVYLGGGFPEEFAAQLSKARDVREGIRDAVRAGLPTLAECGGYMYLASELTDKYGQTFPMAGAISATVTMQNRLGGFGYREVAGYKGNWLLPDDETARGHEFHYSSMSLTNASTPAYEVKHPTHGHEGVLLPNGMAAYTHVHFGSNPRMAERFVARCALFRRDRQSKGQGQRGAGVKD